ncbi:PadR family transcriptional regulator [Agromyces cerinus]|uniref:Transcriptional regulator, PadR family n=1 Tax=Agromyces cerinus subsp. cerinus TaxID=232089 RepID=A0A1N6E279_9MICO|nr:helix-turn-helix transcriptional regulator [Agromyces cerinus]SIN77165.1 transcriptional regulator, PadR family [Agromyces cerinus subsp. cerinus]
MAVRDALLALLAAGPGYGFQLHGDLAERTGGRRDVNVGQSYATLERLGKQGLVESAGATDDGLPLYRATKAGTAATSAWFAGTDASGSDAWDETVDRVLVAASLPSVEVGPVVAAERLRWQERAVEASARAVVDGEHDPAAGASVRLAALAAAAEAARAHAALAWLDEVAAITGRHDLAFAPRMERPRRGRRPSARPAEPESLAAESGEAQASAEA